MARKLGGKGSGGFLSMESLNYIKRAQELDGIFTKRRQAAFDASPNRRKDGTPFQAHRQYDIVTN
jgi:hypothetical protein